MKTENKIPHETKVISYGIPMEYMEKFVKLPIMFNKKLGRLKNAKEEK